MSIYPPDMKPNANAASPVKKQKSSEERLLNEIRVFMFFILLLVAAITIMQYKTYLRCPGVKELSLRKSVPGSKLNEVTGKFTWIDDELTDYARRGLQVESVTRIGTSDNYDVVVSSEFNAKTDQQMQRIRQGD